MSEPIPSSLKADHEALRATVKRAMREPRRTGEAARKLAGLLDVHFLREEKFVLPLLALLPGLAAGKPGAVAGGVARQLDQLRAAVGQLTEEHRAITQATHALASAAEAEDKAEYVDFAQALILHAHIEEEVLYPAALVAGEFLMRLRGA
jgi:iron-sulfur cluster repair protein YtfE (RIC family)